MAKLYNLARMTTATTGTGTITLGSAVSGYLSFADAGVSDADVVDYAIKDGSNSEIGTGTYTASGTTLTRTVTKSTNSNSAISLSGTAEVFISPRAETLQDGSLIKTGTVDAARVNALSTASGSAPSYSARAWVVFTGSTATIRASGNVSGVTRNTTGDYTITFSTAMPDANYALVATGRIDTGGSGTSYSLIGEHRTSSRSTSSVRIFCTNSSFTGGTDYETVSVVVFR